MKQENISKQVYDIVIADAKERIVARNTLKWMEKVDLQIFKHEDGSFTYSEPNMHKYMFNYLNLHINKELGLTAPKENNPPRIIKTDGTSKATKKVAKKSDAKSETAAPDKEDYKTANPRQLIEFRDRYAKDKRIPKELKKLILTDEEKEKLLDKILPDIATSCIAGMQKEIYPNGKTNYRAKSKLSKEELEEYNKQAKQEFKWYKENFIWLFSPNPKWLEKQSFTNLTAAFMTNLINSLYIRRTAIGL